MSDEFYMTEALRLARAAGKCGDVPVGCVIVRGGEIVGRGRNRREEIHDATAHAELEALRQASQSLGRWRLSDCTLYVTLEPCPMCAGALALSGVKRVVYGASDARYGCCGSVYRLTEDPAFPNFCRADGGLLRGECEQLLQAAFDGMRRR